MRFLKATFLIRLNRGVVKGQKTLENKEGDSSPSQTLRRPFAEAQGFGSGLGGDTKGHP